MNLVNLHWTLIALGSGFVGSLLTTRLVQEIAWHHRFHAVGLECLAVLVAIVGWQLWSKRKNDWKVLALEGLGTVIGTFLVLS